MRSSYLTYLERGNYLLHAEYARCKQMDDPDLIELFRRKAEGVYLGILWLEGAISLLEVGEEK